MLHDSNRTRQLLTSKPSARIAGLLLTGAALAAHAGAQGPIGETVQILRDRYHVPHVYADTDEGAFFGVGYAMAQDRLFQMDFCRRSMRGKLAAILDPDDFPKALLRDKRARYIGWGAHADQRAVFLAAADPELGDLLEAFCLGLNKRIEEHRSNPVTDPWPTMFQNLGLTDMDDWTPADCLLIWDRIHTFFVGDPGGEIAAAQDPCPTILADPGAAIVQGPLPGTFCRSEAEPPRKATWAGGSDLKASHHAVIDGSKTASGTPMMLGKPQHRVLAPSLYYEFAVKGATFDCRGAGLAGFPAMMHGWNVDISWGGSSMGGDQADLYQLALDTQVTDSYILDGISTAMTDVHSEVIDVRGQSSVTVTHRKTIWGPVITEYLVDNDTLTPPLPVDLGYAYRAVLLEDLDRHTIQAMHGLMRASTWCEARDALSKWRGPGTHVLFAGRHPSADPPWTIGYTGAVAYPLRPSNAGCAGNWPQDGSTSASHWTGYLPFIEQPWVEGPLDGFISSGNNLALDPALQTHGLIFGAPGDTIRSWRLRERTKELVTTGPVTMSDVLSLSRDAVHPALRVFAQMTAYLDQQGPLPPDAQPAAAKLATWTAVMPSYEVLIAMNDLANDPDLHRYLGAIGQSITTFRPAPLPGTFWDCLIMKYGEGWSGMINLMKDFDPQNPSHLFTQGPHSPCDVEAWVVDRLIVANQIFNENPPSDQALGIFVIAHQSSLQKDIMEDPDQPWSIYPPEDFSVGPFACVDGDTIWSPRAETFKFAIDMGDVDAARALAPVGQSEDPIDPSYRAREVAWRNGTMYDAPLDRDAVIALDGYTIELITYP